MFPKRTPSPRQRKIFGVIVHDARCRHDLTQERLAECMSCSVAWISQVERGKSDLNYIDTLRLMVILELDPITTLEKLGVHVPIPAGRK